MNRNPRAPPNFYVSPDFGGGFPVNVDNLKMHVLVCDHGLLFVHLFGGTIHFISLLLTLVYEKTREVAVGLSYLTTYRVVKPLFATDVSAVLS